MVTNFNHFFLINPQPEGDICVTAVAVPVVSEKCFHTHVKMKQCMDSFCHYKFSNNYSGPPLFFPEMIFFKYFLQMDISFIFLSGGYFSSFLFVINLFDPSGLTTSAVWRFSWKLNISRKNRAMQMGSVKQALHTNV